MARSSCILTTGTPGSGKSYMRAAVFVADEWLPYHQGLHISNMPLDPEALEAFCLKKYGRTCNARERIIRIPDEMLNSWMKREEEKGVQPAGPWDVMGDGKQWSLRGTHIAIDEAHLVIPRAKFVERRRAWRDWLREIRHVGATVEFLTQNLKALDNDVQEICDLRYNIVNRDSDRFLGIPMSDFYELKGGITGEWSPCICQIEKRRRDEGWEALQKRIAWLSSTYYALYDSFSKPLKQTEQEEGEEGEEGDKEAAYVEQHEFQKRNIISLLGWFARRNWLHVVGALGIVAIVVWLSVFDGIQKLMMGFMYFMALMSGMDAPGTVHASEQDEITVEVVSEQVEMAEIPLDTVLFYREVEGGQITYTVGDFAEVIEDNWFLESQAEAQAEELEVLRQEGKTVDMMTHDAVFFSSGERVQVGGMITRSGYDGRKIKAILFAQRRCILDDGTILELGLYDARKGNGFFSAVSASTVNRDTTNGADCEDCEVNTPANASSGRNAAR